MARKILFLLLITCSSCSSIYRFAIDVQEPAAITLPVSAQNVLILNNTVTQPEDYGIERTANGQSVSSNYPLPMDTFVWYAINDLAGTLNESKFFNSIAVYKKPFRTDNEWLSIPGNLFPELQSSFYDMDDFDALLVIDRLLFSVKENVTNIKVEAFSSDLNAFLDLRADGIITCSMYTYGKDRPLTTFTISDSIFSKSMVYSDSTELFKDIPEFILSDLSRELGYKAAKRFIPSWKTENRVLFTSYNARMQEATGYAANHQWTTAESIWSAELEKTTKPLDKAKIEFNLAVVNEMQDKLEPALERAQQAKEHLKNTNQDKNSQEIELVDKYISVLEHRIQNNRLLDLQWGKSDL